MRGLIGGLGLSGLVAAGIVASSTGFGIVPAPAAATRPVPVAVAPAVAVAVPPAVIAPVAAVAPAPAPVPAGYVIKRVLDTGGPLRHGEYFWDEAGVPDGPIVITVDLTAQVISIFRGGYEIGTAAVIYGADDKPTPTGVFPITQKDADHVSNLYGVAMPYMLRLTNDGISIHAAPVKFDVATHGCIGVPIAFAKLLFGQARLGDRVIITDGESLALGRDIPAA